MQIAKPVLSYAPDGDPAEKACIVDGLNFIPTMRGIKSAPSLKSAGAAAFAHTAGEDADAKTAATPCGRRQTANRHSATLYSKPQSVERFWR